MAGFEFGKSVLENLEAMSEQRDMCEVMICEGIDKVFSVHPADKESGAIIVDDALDAGMEEFMNTKKPCLIIEKTWWTFIKNGAGFMRLLRLQSAIRQDAWIEAQKHKG